MDAFIPEELFTVLKQGVPFLKLLANLEYFNSSYLPLLSYLAQRLKLATQIR